MTDKLRGYQPNFAEQHAEMYSGEGRTRKAATTRLILEEALGSRLASSRVLNIGCSTGIIDSELAPAVGSLVGIDIDEKAVDYARRTHHLANVTFAIGDAMAIDYPDASFDIVLCSQVYEHVPDPNRLIAEIERVLAPGGVCYFAATNRFNLMEQHYHLPLLSVIPVSWAHLYLRLLGRGSYYYERHLTYSQLHRLVARFRVEDVTRRILDDPDQYAARYLFDGRKLAVARLLARLAYWAFPGYIWLLWKQPEVCPDNQVEHPAASRTEPSGAIQRDASHDQQARRWVGPVGAQALKSM